MGCSRRGVLIVWVILLPAAGFSQSPSPPDRAGSLLPATLSDPHGRELEGLPRGAAETNGSSLVPAGVSETIGEAVDHRPSPDVCLDAGDPICDRRDPHVFHVFYGYDAWRGVPDGSWTNNGVHFGASVGSRLGEFSDATGIGLQFGGTIGVYDWAGTDYRLDNQNKPTTQGMLTYGLFRRADERTNWSAAIANDWMLNSNYSVFGEDSVLWQWRAQIGYIFDDANEWGVWGAWRGHGETQRVMYFGDVTWQPIQQLHLFWHHKWTPGGADTWIMIGIPEQDRLTGGGSLGDYIAGAYSLCPLNDRFMLYSMVNYMHQSARPGDPGAREEAWNFYIGVAFFPQPLARSRTVRGHKWSPLLPVANNGLFLVDASHNY